MFSRTAQAMTESREWSVRLGKSMIAASVRITSSEAERTDTGKACKNIHRCYILQEGNPVPIILALPPTSLKYIRDYIGKRILLKGLRCYDAVTKITLKKEKSADGITYSRAAFAFVSKLTDEQRAETKAMVEMIKAQADNIPDIDEADYNTGAAVDAADFQSVDGDPYLPFN